jgi:hypothetical protein
VKRQNENNVAYRISNMSTSKKVNTDQNAKTSMQGKSAPSARSHVLPKSGVPEGKGELISPP